MDDDRDSPEEAKAKAEAKKKVAEIMKHLTAKEADTSKICGGDWYCDLIEKQAKLKRKKDIASGNYAEIECDDNY